MLTIEDRKLLVAVGVAIADLQQNGSQTAQDELFNALIASINDVMPHVLSDTVRANLQDS